MFSSSACGWSKYRRKARKLRQYLPFTANTIACIEHQATAHRRLKREDLCTSIRRRDGNRDFRLIM
jgi:hypothetical protein